MHNTSVQDCRKKLMDHKNHSTKACGISFTHREIDVISCVLSGRTSKKIASFLSISPKTAENHIRNVMLKLGCNSQEGIRDFIENSGQFFFIRKHYQNLLTSDVFKQQLRKVFRFIHEKTLVCCLHYWPGKEDKTTYVHEIEEYLNLAGIKVILDKREDTRFSADLAHENSKQVNHVIYVVSEELIRKFYTSDEISQLVQKAHQNPRFLTFLSLDEDTLDIPQEFREVGCLNFNMRANYYLSVFEILKKIAPNVDMEAIISEFKEYYDLTYNNSVGEFFETEKEIKAPEKNFSSLLSETPLKRKRRGFLTFSILSFSLFCVGFLILKGNQTNLQISHIRETIHSDLIIPTESSILKRSHLMTQIEDKLKGQEEIQTVVLVGIGGAGKTTLARQYLRSQKLPLVWEINAEREESLVSSFENLAYALSKTPEDKKEVDFIHKTENPYERARRVRFFVKKKLKEQKSWYLLFDNVEKFSDIKEYYPHDSSTWGSGKIIITTRDNNIKNNNYINPNNVINIEELDKDEKSLLFTKILSNNNLQSITPSQREQIENFLEKIPPFPLDVSTAAYYIKDTKISYEEYIERLKASSSDFEKAQEALLKETSGYIKTRYGIITLTLKNLIGESQAFKDLLIFISLLDSQEIPHDLLMAYKESAVVEKFVHDLRKQSLITTKAFNADQSLSTLSIHRSTQEICLNYFKSTLNSADYAQTLQNITQTLATYANNVSDKFDDLKMRCFVKHGEMFLDRGNILKSINKENVAKTIEFLIGMEAVYKDLGNYEKSKDLSYVSYQICKKHYGDHHIKTAETLVSMGVAYANMGNYAKSKDLYKEALPLYYQYYGKDHVETAWLLVNLGNTYKGLGQFIEAKQAFEESLSVFRKHYPREHEKICTTLVRLGCVYRRLGDYEKAKELLEENLVIHKKLYGENHIKSGWILAHLGNVYRSLGNYKKAKDLLEQALIIYKKQYGETHVRTSWVLVHLGNTYRHLGYLEKAKDFFEQGFAAHKEYYGENNLEAGWASVHLGNIYRCLGHHEKAKDLLEQGLRIHKANLGDNHIMTAWTLVKMGKFYLSLGDYEKAKVFFEKSLTVYKTYYNLNHIKLAEISLALGQTYLLTNETEKTEGFLKQSLQSFTINNHPGTYLALEALGNLNFKKAMLEKNTENAEIFKNKAIEYLKRALEISKIYFPEGSPDIARRIQSKLQASAG